MKTKTPSISKNNEKTFLGHPVGLFVLFFTEMWERFSYYGMRVLLVLYMTDYLILSIKEDGNVVWGFESLESVLTFFFGALAVQPLASQIYGLYTGFVYLTPFFGGLIADQFMGQRKMVVVGGILMAIGHFLMAFEVAFLLALVFLILGNGAFKPNISTQVGSLYPEGDPRRDSAFTIFYMGINIGAFFSPFVCGTLGQVYGWHYGFAAAGVGMLIGLFIYLWGQKYLKQDQFNLQHKSKEAKSEPLTPKEWKAVFGLVGLCFLNIVFWAVFEQQGNTLQYFAEHKTDWNLGSFSIPSTWLQAMNPMFIFLFAPFLIAFWKKQGKKQMSSVGKMSVGCFLLGLSFLFMIYAVNGLGEGQRIYWLWFVPTVAVFTMGELWLSPIGLSLVTKVAPAKIVSMMMGMWFLSSFFGNYLGGYIGSFYNSMTPSGFFILLMLLGVGAGFVFFILKKPLKEAIGHDV